VTVDQEFDRQLETLLKLDYPSLTGRDEAALVDQVEPLRSSVRHLLDDADAAPTPSRVPFVIVVGPRLAAAETLVPLLRLRGRTLPGVVDRNHDGPLSAFEPIPEVELPASDVYALVDVERGEEFCGVRPQEALPEILGRRRTPLTTHEGIALVTHAPETLEKNRCFMLSGSRRGDRRVPALWISGRQPKLGWCWDGNPHTWLGVASTSHRVGALLTSRTT
jgi:hypothetical protein